MPTITDHRSIPRAKPMGPDLASIREAMRIVAAGEKAKATVAKRVRRMVDAGVNMTELAAVTGLTYNQVRRIAGLK